MNYNENKKDWYIFAKISTLSIVSVLNLCWIEQEKNQLFKISWALPDPQNWHNKFKLFPKNNKQKCKAKIKLVALNVIQATSNFVLAKR